MYYDLDGFGKAIRTLRKSIKLTQTDVRSFVGLNEDTLRKLENGTSMPKIETIDMLSVAYKTDVFKVFSRYKISFDNYFEDRVVKLLPKIRSLDYKAIEKEAKTFEEKFSSSKVYKIDSIHQKSKQFSEYLKSVSNLENSFKDKSRDDLTKLLEVTGYNLNQLKTKSGHLNLDKLEIRIFVLISVIYRFKNEFDNSIVVLLSALNAVINKYKEDNDFLYFYFLLVINLMTVYHRENDYKEFNDLYMDSLKVIDEKLSVNTLASYFIRVGINKHFLEDEKASNFVNYGLDILKDIGYEERSNKYKETFISKYPELDIK